MFINIGDIIGPTAKQPNRMLLISFFASWCEACKNELPQIEKYYRDYHEKGLSSVYICIDTEKEGAAKAGKFVTAQKFSATVLHDSYNIVARRYFKDEFILPATYLIGADGKVLAVFTGGGNKDVEALGTLLSSFFSPETKHPEEVNAKSAAGEKER